MHIKQQFIRFLLIGGINFILNSVTYTVLVILGIHYLISSGIGWIIGVISSYWLNRHFTFKSDTPVTREFSKYLIVYIIQLFVSWTGLVFLVGVLHFGALVAYAINVIFVTATSYLGLKYFAFRTIASPLK
jgi:putative flippase GtrA